MFVCKICGNTNKLLIGYDVNKKPYCRKCISLFRSKTVNVKKYEENYSAARLNYALSKVQQKASDEILNYVKKNESVIVNAVCGAGKTELVYQSIEYFLSSGKNIAFAIPRKDVVKEIYTRLKHDYPSVKITMVCGGKTDELFGQIVVLTTHQLFRYPSYFDLLILDEADAFPYYGNDLLEMFLNKSCKGVIIYLSATIKDSYKKICSNVVFVNRRYHNYDLPVPEYIKYNYFNKIDVLNKIIKSIRNKPILIFVPTIGIGKELASKTKYHFVYSSFEYKENCIEDFRAGKIKILITSQILERGITLKGIQVIVYEANHRLFDEASLVQISGRVGRKISDPTGKVFFLATNMSESMKKCIKEIKSKNESEK